MILDGQRRTAFLSDERALDFKCKAILKIVEMLKRVQHDANSRVSITGYGVSRRKAFHRLCIFS